MHVAMVFGNRLTTKIDNVGTNASGLLSHKTECMHAHMILIYLAGIHSSLLLLRNVSKLGASPTINAILYSSMTTFFLHGP